MLDVEFYSLYNGLWAPDLMMWLCRHLCNFHKRLPCFFTIFAVIFYCPYQYDTYQSDSSRHHPQDIHLDICDAAIVSFEVLLGIVMCIFCFRSIHYYATYTSIGIGVGYWYRSLEANIIAYLVLGGLLGIILTLLVYIAADSAAVKPVDNGVPAAAAAKKKEKVTLRKKDSKVNFVHPWLACNLKGHSGPVLGLDFSPNGKYLASCSEGSFMHHFWG